MHVARWCCGDIRVSTKNLPNLTLNVSQTICGAQKRPHTRTPTLEPGHRSDLETEGMGPFASYNDGDRETERRFRKKLHLCRWLGTLWVWELTRSALYAED